MSTTPEPDKMQSEISNLKEQLEHALNPVHSCGDDCQRAACVMRRERDKLKAEVERLEREIKSLRMRYEFWKG